MERETGFSIKFKILILVLVVTIFLTISLISLSFLLSSDFLNDLIVENGTRNIQLYSNLVHNWLDKKKDDLEIYANNEIIQTADWPIEEDLLIDEIETSSDEFSYFFVANNNGDYSTTDLKNVGNIKNEDYFKRAIEGQTYLSRPLKFPLATEKVIIVTTPLEKKPQTTNAIFGAAIKLDQLTKYLSKFKVSHFNSYSYIINKHGLVLAHPDPDLISNKNILKSSRGGEDSLKNNFGELKNNKLGYLTYQEQNQEYYIFYSKIIGTDGWKIVTQVPNDYLNIPLMLVRKKLWIIGLAAIIISAIVSILIANNISAPIIRLRNIFSQGAEGNLTVRTNFNRNDEIGQAADSFNKMMEKISQLTYNDILTGLLSLSYFKDKLRFDLEQIKDQDQDLVLFSIGINDFETIKDNFGHYIGDQVLKKIATRIERFVDDDVYIARTNKEFFLYWKKEISEVEFKKLAKEILNKINRKYEINGQIIHAEASLGIAVYPESGRSSQRLIKNAGLAQHLVSEQSGDSIQVYSPGMEEELSEKMRLEAKLKYALENKQFVLYYQPVVATQTKKIKSLEALIRWYHPVEGMIAPDKFISIIEDNGMIVEIGDWVLKEACKSLKKLHQAGYDDLSVAVNIAPQQFQSDNFVNDIKSILTNVGLEAKYLELEITERATITNMNYTIELLNELKELGVKISIDDFGTGYSSLNYLKEFAIDTLKIDKSFVCGLNAQGENNAIAETIITMAHNLKLNVTAEGVENSQQLNFLEEKKCDKLQGNLFSPTVPRDEVETVLEKFNA